MRIDLTPYLEIRRRMRLLPNLLDYGIAYQIFRPVVRVDSVLRAVRLTSVTPATIAFYLGYILVNLVLTFAIAVRIRSLVLSDSRRTVAAIGGLFLLFALVLLSAVGGAAGAVVGAIPLVYTYASYRYLRRLDEIASHRVFGALAGLDRRSFAFAGPRYAFWSAASLTGYRAVASAAWKPLLAYLLLGAAAAALYIAFRTPAGQQLRSWLDSLTGLRFALAFAVFLLVGSQAIAYTRRFIANRTVSAMRELRSRLAVSAGVLARRDSRPPILLLRSFRDDSLTVDNERFWGHRFLARDDTKVRLEEVLVETLYAYGPVVALTNPADQLPPLGAARDNVSDADWQTRVDEYLDNAHRIVTIAGDTPGLKWELVRIREKGLEGRSMVVFPPSASGNLVSFRAADAEPVMIYADRAGNAFAYAEALRLALAESGAQPRSRAAGAAR